MGDAGPSRSVAESAAEGTPLAEIALLFLRLGLTAFGGPAAHIALMRQEVVDRRQWLTEQEFLDLLGAANLIPGPNSTELAIHIGYQRARWAGLIVAGVCFILPAALMVTAIAWAYVQYGRLPAVLGILDGVKPVVIAVVAQALWNLGRSALKTRGPAALAVAAAAALFGVDEIALLFGAGAIAGGAAWLRQPRKSSASLGVLAAASLVLIAVPLLLNHFVHPPSSPGVWPLFLVFAKIGSVLYGSGYVLLAFLRSHLVTRVHRLTSAQLLDAVAVGQVTPGPVFTTATFIGFMLAGPLGALAATAGIFAPAFVFVAISGPLVPRMRGSAVAGGFLDGVNAASLALMAAVTWELAVASVRSPLSVALLVASGVLLIRYRVNATWLLLAGAFLGLAAGLWLK